MSRLRKDVKSLTLNQGRRKDYDPEDERPTSEDESASGTDVEDVVNGREHYENVGKSRLRKPEAPALDAKYGGVVISRTTLGDESDDDPFAPDKDGFDDEDPFAVPATGTGSAPEIDSMDSHEFLPGKLNERAGDTSEDETVESKDDQDQLSDQDMEPAEGSESTGDEDEDEDTDELSAEEGSRALSPQQQKRADLRALLSGQAQSLASGLSQATNADVKKGRAVKKQYQTFDRLLDCRMKIQKALNTPAHLPTQQDTHPLSSEAEEALRGAQQAALNLFNTMSSFRDSIKEIPATGNTSKKRKRLPKYESLDDLDSMWSALNDHELDAQASRRVVLDKWSNKVKASDPTRATANARYKNLDPTAHNDNLTKILDTYVINEQEKHFRSDEAQQQEHSEASSLPYDDSLFYQSLLRELIASRANASSAGDNLSLSALPHKLHPSGNKQNKKTIDTKASKGRKVRYTVHEKLQNFMAAEGDTGRDTAMWSERGKNEFFGSLFGQDRALIEDNDEPMDDQENGNLAEVEALRLFRT